MRNRRSFELVAAAGFILLFVAQAIGDQTLKGRSSGVQIDVPAGWSAHPIPKGALSTIQLWASNSADGGSAMVIDELGDPSLMTLSDYGDRIRDGTAAKMTNPTHTEWEKIKLDGRDALRCELSGGGKKAGDLDLSYVITVVKTDESYDQILTWAETKKFAAEKAELIKIADSFKRNSAEPITLKSRDGTCQLTLPAGWADHPPKAGSEVQAEGFNQKVGAYVEIRSLSKDGATETLNQFADSVVDKMASESNGTAKKDWTEIKVDGHKAIRGEEHFKRGDTSFALLLTFIDSDGHFYLVNSYTTDARFAGAKAEMAKLADGFKELKPGK